MKKTVLLTLVFVFVFQIAKTQDPTQVVPSTQDSAQVVPSTQDSTQVAPSTQVVPSNDVPKKSPNNRIYYGGNVGLSFGSYTMIGLYPLVGYKVTDKLSFGGKIGYEYIQDKRYEPSYSSSNYGASIFTRYRIIPRLYLHAEYAGLNYAVRDIDGEAKREWIPFLFVGGGFSQSLGNHAWLNLQVLFDVLQNENSPYSSWEPFFSVGIGVGF